MYIITCASQLSAEYSSFRRNPRGKVYLEDVPGLPSDPDDYYEDTDIIVG